MSAHKATTPASRRLSFSGTQQHSAVFKYIACVSLLILSALQRASCSVSCSSKSPMLVCLSANRITSGSTCTVDCSSLKKTLQTGSGTGSFLWSSSYCMTAPPASVAPNTMTGDAMYYTCANVTSSAITYARLVSQVWALTDPFINPAFMASFLAYYTQATASPSFWAYFSCLTAGLPSLSANAVQTWFQMYIKVGSQLSPPPPAFNFVRNYLVLAGSSYSYHNKQGSLDVIADLYVNSIQDKLILATLILPNASLYSYGEPYTNAVWAPYLEPSFVRQYLQGGANSELAKMLGGFIAQGGVTLISATTNTDLGAVIYSSSAGRDVHSNTLSPTAEAREITHEVCHAPLQLLNAAVLASLIQHSQALISASYPVSSGSSSSPENALGCKCAGATSGSRDPTAFALLDVHAAKAVFGSDVSVPLINAALNLPPGGGLNVAIVGGLPLICTASSEHAAEEAAADGALLAAALEGLEHYDLLPVWHVHGGKVVSTGASLFKAWKVSQAGWVFYMGAGLFPAEHVVFKEGSLSPAKKAASEDDVLSAQQAMWNALLVAIAEVVNTTLIPPTPPGTQYAFFSPPPP
ncbi:hypothetical protein CEUSTIGMA_g1868.t1 [Chlamydomonas eustigma]|uniref:Uncharacterized protein n=1 Tax=Chlamydomonas eustigma TaxID=1157962 RepID=A0A250WUM7_9CHLO|nr:hypothetical protein CEUSTIGMA_g1868.t1 [Chlamydomonas eustigma]|eukprot:GAX74419.1 hypothetical protein CEUSTIGMA_g1868.t1 [Chlamydomonas eustigma]